MATDIKDKSAIVTGGAKGLGFQYCRHLLIRQAKNVAVLDLESSDGIVAVKKLNDEFGTDRAFFVPTDVAEGDKFEESFKTAVKTLGGLDILINNAGILNDQLWSTMIDINIKGVVKGTLLAIETMGRHNGGNGGLVVNAGSIVGIEPLILAPVYVATKHAIVGFSRSIAGLHRKTGVAVKTICPHMTQTDLLLDLESKLFDFVDEELCAEKMKKYENQMPEDVAGAVMKLIEEAPNGAVWLQVGGQSPRGIEFPSIQSMMVPV